MRHSIALALLLLAPTLRAEDVLDGPHYRLHWEGPRAEGKEALAVLEAAYPQLQRFFGAQPRLRPVERLAVRFYATHAAWAAGLRADGATPPAAGGYYWPPRRTAYLYRQPTTYYTRVLLLHEAVHQFHYLARTRNRYLPFAWYVEGLAEYLGRHCWDGKTLELGAVPLLSLSDYAARALELLERRPPLDLTREIAGHGTPRPLGWALVAFLATQQRPRFDALRAELDRGAAPLQPFLRWLGNPQAMRGPLVAWLRRSQESWAPLFNEWEGIGTGRVEGRAAGVVSTCRIKGQAAKLAATAELPARGWAGLLLHHTGGDDYTVALVERSGSLRIDRLVKGRWQRLLAGRGLAPDKQGRIALEAVREGPLVWFVAGGRRHGPFTLPGATFGLALDSCRARFRDVNWTK